MGISLCGLNAMSACTDLIYSGILQRHPGVKVALSEGGSGWPPTDRAHGLYVGAERIRGRQVYLAVGTVQATLLDVLDQRRDLGHRPRNLIGVDKLMYETDYPHNDTNWPNGRKVLASMLEDVPDHEARRIAGLNAQELYKFGARNRVVSDQGETPGEARRWEKEECGQGGWCLQPRRVECTPPSALPPYHPSWGRVIHHPSWGRAILGSSRFDDHRKHPMNWLRSKRFDSSSEFLWPRAQQHPRPERPPPKTCNPTAASRPEPELLTGGAGVPAILIS